MEVLLTADEAYEEARQFASTRIYNNVYQGRQLPRTHFSAFGRYASMIRTKRSAHVQSVSN